MRVPFATPVRTPEQLSTGALFLAVAICALVALTASGPSRAQTVDGTVLMGAAPAKAASAGGRPAPAGGASRAAKSPTSPLWSELTPPQQQALGPLSTAWPAISEAQKRKWLVISGSYGRLSAPEQEKLHSRMTEWVALSPQQRNQARMNFAESKQLSSDDKKAKWEAYQALPAEEKRKLAAGAASAAKPPVTAAAVKPVPARKLATVAPAGEAKGPHVAAAPNAAARPPAQPNGQAAGPPSTSN
jgi:hypothetical protein